MLKLRDYFEFNIYLKLRESFFEILQKDQKIRVKKDTEEIKEVIINPLSHLSRSQK